MTKINVDMHVHTSCSRDSLIPADRLIETCDYHCIDCVAVTDHDTIECAVELHNQSPEKIIIGEEIHTTFGEIIGLFLKEWVQPFLSPMDTVKRIKDQGGIVYIPHPFDSMRASVLRREALEAIYEDIDIIEVFNSRNAFPWSNKKAMNFASERRILAGVGSDAHTRYEIGKAYITIEQFRSAEDFLSKLQDASLHTRKTPVGFNFLNKIYKIARNIG